LEEVEAALNKKSIKEGNNAVYKFKNDFDVLCIYPRDLELLEEQLQERLVFSKSGRMTSKSNSRRSRSH
jgi:hypothetical protein